MKIEHDIKLDFNDVLIKPKRSMAVSRSEVDLTRKFKLLNSTRKELDAGIPIIAANMDTVGTIEMAVSLSKHNCWTALHKFYTLVELEKFFKENCEITNRVFYTTGIRDEDYQKLKMLYKFGVNPQNICIDVPNAYTQAFIEYCKEIRNWFPEAFILGGNVCTPEQTQELLMVGGLDCIKVGVGNGSACLTRHMTHVGLPQLTAILDCADAAHGVGGLVCSDGGIRTPGNIACAFGASADFVMIGGYFAGHAECNGVIKTENNKQYMEFYGMSSDTAMKKHYGEKASYRASEGRTMQVPYKGPISDTVEQILGGLRSTCTYVGTTKLKDLAKCTTFVRVNRIHDNPSI